MRWTEEKLQEYKVRNFRMLGKEVIDIADESPESSLDKKISLFTKDKGLYAFHDYSHAKNKAGILDWTIALPNGKVLFIENKSKRGKLSKEQKQNILKLLGHKHLVYTCKSYKRFLEIIEENING